jgi:hypothetical protein
MFYHRVEDRRTPVHEFSRCPIPCMLVYVQITTTSFSSVRVLCRFEELVTAAFANFRKVLAKEPID